MIQVRHIFSSFLIQVSKTFSGKLKFSLKDFFYCCCCFSGAQKSIMQLVSVSECINKIRQHRRQLDLFIYCQICELKMPPAGFQECNKIFFSRACQKDN